MWKKSIIIAAVLHLVSCTETEPPIGPPVGPPVVPEPSSFKYAENSDLIINEVCVKNSGSSLDEYREDPDWIEIYNRGDTAINLLGYTLSDDSTDLRKWSFGDISIEPKQYLLVYASDRDISSLKEKPADEICAMEAPSVWTDSMGVGGHSTIVPYEYPTIAVRDSSGRRIVSATINQVDNRPDLDWSSASISIKLQRQNFTLARDYSMYNMMKLIMTLEKGKQLTLRFTQALLPDWKGGTQTLIGTGVENDTYVLNLVQGAGGLDLTKLTGFRLESPQYYFKPISLTLRSIIFIHSGYNLHTNFKLSGEEGGLFLTDRDTCIHDRVPLSVLPNDLTQGKLDGGWRVLKRATPGAENVQEFYNSIADVPQTVTRGGFYSKPVRVELTASPELQIRYTLDGSIPNAKSRPYSGPISIEKTTVLRFAAFGNGVVSSSIQTETFLINEITSLPVVSIATDSSWLFDPDTGIYVEGPNASEVYPYFGANFWGDKEIPAHLEFFETNKQKKFSIDAGVSIAGNWSRAERKKSLAINFRERYGTSELIYPLFSKDPNITHFKRIVLRNNGGNYSKAMIEDPMMQSLMDDRNMDYQKYRPAVVFINGRYFGLHQIVEPANHDYVYSNYGLKKEQIDFFDYGGALKRGTPDNWFRLMNILRSIAGLDCENQVSDADFQQIRNEVDVYNFIDYMAFEVFIGNTDWPYNNCRYWRDRSANGKWRWLIYDVDFGFGGWGNEPGAELPSYNTLAFALDATKGPDDYPNGSDYTYPLRAMLKNEAFKEDFINRFATLLATNFDPVRVRKRIDVMAEEIRGEVDRDFKRWDRSVEKWPVDINNLKTYADARPSYIYRFIGEQFGLDTVCTVEITSTNGIVYVNGMSIPGSFRGTYFAEVPLTLRAIPQGGRRFLKWSDGNTENPRRLVLRGDTRIDPVFQ